MLLKVGRHIRPKKHFKLIIGREDGENKYMEGYRKQFVHMHASSCVGPSVLVDGELKDDEDLKLAAQITARYSKDRNSDNVTVEITDLNGVSKTLNVKPLAPHQIEDAWIL